MTERSTRGGSWPAKGAVLGEQDAGTAPTSTAGSPGTPQSSDGSWLKGNASRTTPASASALAVTPRRHSARGRSRRLRIYGRRREPALDRQRQVREAQPVDRSVRSDQGDGPAVAGRRVVAKRAYPWIRRSVGPGGVSHVCRGGVGGFVSQPGPGSVPGVAGAGLGCLQAADEGVDTGGEPLVAVVQPDVLAVGG
jgi:hypothetical protein